MNSLDQQPFRQVDAPPDRRRDPRHSIKVQIELREDGGNVPLRMNTADLSRGGCYVELMMPLPVGAAVTATLWFNDCSVHVRGRVVTRHPQFGNGIQFLHFEGNGESLLAEFLDGIDLFPA